MSRGTRWQDWINAVLGVILFVTPFVVGNMTQTAGIWTAYIGGVVLFVVGAGSLVFRWYTAVEYIPLVAGIALFVAPWVLGFSSNTGLAWSDWIIGLLAFINAGSAAIVDRGHMMGRPAASH